ncbi:MAG: cysteine--tRNA ligase [Clostridiales bacterium]|nr:MAG: cysteine--tRNA ligase [Clostridiales bacterium]
MDFKMYNSLSRTVEKFEPYQAGKVRMYTCGPTVYNFAHIGNLRTYISEDILEKSLNYLGYDVLRCMNITDVGHLESDADDGEDKMLKGARRENKTVWQVAQFYTDAFFDDCAKLNIAKPAIIDRATDRIADYIELIQGLEAKGYTYTVDGNVYFDISKFDDYTKLSGMDLEALKTAVRDDVEHDANKRNPQDFVLWFTKSKFANQAMKWDSPWGVGYPGWHIECSVIALKNLGPKLDIHCGGVDHIPVHHTNEIAQTESYTGESWTKYWWHAEFLIDNTGKMSKSKGEFLTLALLEKKGYQPLDYRFYCLGSHYRKQLPFSFDKLDMAKKAYQKLRAKTLPLCKCQLTDQALSTAAVDLQNQFRAALADDLNTANALTVVYAVLKSELDCAEKHALIAEFDAVLSLDLLVKSTVDSAVDSDWVEGLIAERASAKANKDWATADAIRDQLAAAGVILKDSATGTTWQMKE